MEGPTASKKEKFVPILEKPESVSYLGVELPKAENRENAPKKEQYADYISDEFALELQKKIAVSWKQGDPVLIEAGTSIGKTTAVRKMCADLGYEVHYVNLNGATDIEDLMGRYIPNRERIGPTDPEYVFADGKVTSGLRQEEGKIKVVLLDEYNSAAPNILIRLHEVLDALERDGEVVLSEDASEQIRVNKNKTKVVGLMNPPGRGYLQREPLDPAQIRRWVYHKEVSELPAETLKHSARALFNLEGQTASPAESAYLFANESVLTPEQLKEIPGIEDILPKYLEFHEAAKELIKNRTIAADQPQKFFFDDREEPKRVRDFIAAFYRGDLNQTMQEALRYYYSGKLLEADDKTKLEELVRTVEYVAPQNTKRKSFETNEGREWEELAAFNDQLPGIISGLERGEAGVSFEEAEAILGKDFLGQGVVEKIFGLRLEHLDIPFSREELERAKELGQQLILYTDELVLPADGSRKKESRAPLTLESLKAGFTKSHDGKKVFYSEGSTDFWYKDEPFFKNEKPRTGWRLTSKDLISNSTSKNYVNQTDVLIDHLQKEVFKGIPFPKQYTDAINEWKKKRAEIEPLATSAEEAKWKRGSQMLADLAITKLTRELPVEVMYRFILNDQVNKDKPLPSMYTWTVGRSSGGFLVHVGLFVAEGALVGYDGPGYQYDSLGVSFSRS